MKNRQGFVSNSSSSSFIIKKEALTGEQIDKIINHVEEAEKMIDMYCNADDAWSIESDEYIIKGSTWMDNFDMEEFLDRIGVSSDDVKWEY
jgi:hypothetical protein